MNESKRQAKMKKLMKKLATLESLQDEIFLLKRVNDKKLGKVCRKLEKLERINL